MQAIQRSCFLIVLAHVALVGCGADEVVQEPAGPVDVALVPYIGRLLSVDAVLGADTARLLFDTGGAETFISPELAAKVGCTPSGRSVGFRMNGDRIEHSYCSDVTLVIADIPFHHERVGILDVGALLPADFPRVDGVLSLVTLSGRLFTLHLAERRLTLESPTSFRERIQGMSRLRSRIATGLAGGELTVFLRGAVGGGSQNGKGWFLLDSGNLDVVQVAPHVRTGGDVNEQGTWEAELTLEGVSASPAIFRTRDIIYDGVLSEAFLRRWTLAFDLSQNEVWASQVPPDGSGAP